MPPKHTQHTLHTISYILTHLTCVGRIGRRNQTLAMQNTLPTGHGNYFGDGKIIQLSAMKFSHQSFIKWNINMELLVTILPSIRSSFSKRINMLENNSKDGERNHDLMESHENERMAQLLRPVLPPYFPLAWVYYTCWLLFDLGCFHLQAIVLAHVWSGVCHITSSNTTFDQTCYISLFLKVKAISHFRIIRSASIIQILLQFSQTS